MVQVVRSKPTVRSNFSKLKQFQVGHVVIQKNTRQKWPQSERPGHFLKNTTKRSLFRRNVILFVHKQFTVFQRNSISASILAVKYQLDNTVHQQTEIDYLILYGKTIKSLYFLAFCVFLNWRLFTPNKKYARSVNENGGLSRKKLQSFTCIRKVSFSNPKQKVIWTSFFNKRVAKKTDNSEKATSPACLPNTFWHVKRIPSQNRS